MSPVRVICAVPYKVETHANCVQQFTSWLMLWSRNARYAQTISESTTHGFPAKSISWKSVFAWWGYSVFPWTTCSLHFLWFLAKTIGYASMQPQRPKWSVNAYPNCSSNSRINIHISPDSNPLFLHIRNGIGVFCALPLPAMTNSRDY